MKKLKGVLIFTAAIFLVSLVYFISVYNRYEGREEQETVFTEVGEGIGGLGLAVLAIIYGRTVLKLSLGKGALAERILPEIYEDVTLPLFKKVLNLLNKTHLHVGVAAIAVIALHALFMGLADQNLFLYLVLILIAWQGLFGFFLSWRYSPRTLRKVSYFVHAQFLTGIMIGIFAFFGHLLAGD